MCLHTYIVHHTQLYRRYGECINVLLMITTFIGSNCTNSMNILNNSVLYLVHPYIASRDVRIQSTTRKLLIKSYEYLTIKLLSVTIAWTDSSFGLGVLFIFWSIKQSNLLRLFLSISSRNTKPATTWGFLIYLCELSAKEKKFKTYQILQKMWTTFLL